MDRRKLTILNKPMKILYLLNEMGDLGFNTIVKESHLSRNTVLKYISSLEEQGLIKRKEVKVKNRTYLGYSITKEGSAELSLDENINWFSTITIRNNNLETLRSKNLIRGSEYRKNKEYLAKIEDTFFNLLNNSVNILEYGGEGIGNVAEIVGKIGRYISYFGEKFFTKPHNIYTHLSAIFIFFNSIEHPQYHINQSLYIDIYGQVLDEFRQKVQDIGIFREILKIFLNNNSLIEEIELLFSKIEENKMDKIYPEEFFNNALNSIIKQIDAEFENKKIQDNKLLKKIDRILSTQEIIPPSHENSEIILEHFDKNRLKNTFYKKYQQNFLSYYDMKKRIIQNFDEELNKILEDNLGLQSFRVNYEPYFFHKKDIVGKSLYQKVMDALTEELINKSIFGIKNLNPLISMAEDITEDMLAMRLIWDEIKDKFKDIVLDLLFKESNTLKLRKSRTDFDKVDFNEIKGFCPVCGTRVLIDALDCEFCKSTFKQDELIYNIKEAQKIAKEYTAIEEPKNKDYDESLFYRCECGQLVGRSWSRCSRCKRKLI